MRSPSVIISVLILVAGCTCPGFAVSVGDVSAARSALYEKVEAEAVFFEEPFHARKRLTYNIAWNGIPVGSITTESGDVSTYLGKKVYDLKIVTESNKFLSTIYRVEDTYSSYVAADTMSSLRYEADRKEGRYRKHVIVEYDFDKMEAKNTNILDGSVKFCPIYGNPQDPVSAVCYFMAVPISSGDVIKMTINLNEKNYTVYTSVGKKKKIRVPALGLRESFKVSPRVELNGEEFTKGRVWAYVSADKDRYPLYGVIRIPFGIVTAILVKVEDIE